MEQNRYTDAQVFHNLTTYLKTNNSWVKKEHRFYFYVNLENVGQF